MSLYGSTTMYLLLLLEIWVVPFLVVIRNNAATNMHLPCLNSLEPKLANSWDLVEMQILIQEVWVGPEILDF